MGLPDYNYDRYPNAFNRRGYGFSQRDWRDMNRPRRQRIRNAWEPQQAPEPDATIPIAYESTPPGQNPDRDYSAHPFFDPNASYITNPNRSQAVPPGSPAFNTYATENSPEGYYYGLLNQQGFGGLDAKSQAAQGMYRDYARGYQAAKLQNHDLWFPEFMGTQDIQANVRNMSNRQLGIDENLYGGRDRWSLRGY